MINPRDRVLLDPAHLRLIIGSLLIAYLIALLPWSGLALELQPDWVLLVLMHWWLREPWRVGQGTGFIAGLLMDVVQTGALGVHALAYSFVSWLILRFRTRLLGFTPAAQAPQLLPLFIVARVTAAVAAVATGSGFPRWTHLAACLVDMAAWIPITLLLHQSDLARSHRAP